MPTLGVIWAGIKLALNILAQLLTGQAAQATSNDVTLVKTIVTNAELQLINLTYGLDAAYAQRVDIISRLTVLQASVTAIPTAPQLAANPVILPTTPPAGYGSPSLSDIALQVWSYVLPDMAGAGDALSDLYDTQNNTVARNGLIVPGYLWQAAMSNNNFNQLSETSATPWGIIDETTILSTDATILAWLQRVYPTWGWTSNYRDGNAGAVVLDQNSSDVWWTCTMSQSQFTGLKGSVSSVLVPPIWPGLAFATLGTPVALAVGLTITEPMDGVIVALTSEPAKSGFFTFDDVNSYRNLGALSFFDDDGHQELPQGLGFTDAAYCPKTMVRAAGVKVRCVGGVAGTITPWVIA